MCIKSRLHCRSPIAATATSVISSCILWIAANPILRRVHLHAYTLTVALESRFQRHQRPWPSVLFCHQGGVFLPNVWLSVLHLLHVAVPLPPTSTKQGAHRDNVLASTFEALRRNYHVSLSRNILTRLVTQSTTL